MQEMIIPKRDDEKFMQHTLSLGVTVKDTKISYREVTTNLL